MPARPRQPSAVTGRAGSGKIVVCIRRKPTSVPPSTTRCFRGHTTMANQPNRIKLSMTLQEGPSCPPRPASRRPPPRTERTYTQAPMRGAAGVAATRSPRARSPAGAHRFSPPCPDCGLRARAPAGLNTKTKHGDWPPRPDQLHAHLLAKSNPSMSRAVIPFLRTVVRHRVWRY